MKTKERIDLSLGDKIFDHYLFVGVLCIPACMFGYMHIIESLDSKVLESSFYMSCITLVFAPLVYFYQKRKTYFNRYPIRLLPKEFKEVVKITARELNWQVAEVSEGYIVATRYGSGLLNNSSQRIAIKREENSILINSIKNPKGRYSPSFKKNKENVAVFIENARDFIDGKDIYLKLAKKRTKQRAIEEQKEKGFWEGSEWTVGNILMRLIGYGFFFIFLLIGLYFLFVDEGIGISLILLPLSAVIFWIYIRIDFQILIEKKRRRNGTK
ncbi:MAG: hypothetical protein ACI8YQ_002917 [Polaribacter sp.]